MNPEELKQRALKKAQEKLKLKLKNTPKPRPKKKKPGCSTCGKAR